MTRFKMLGWIFGLAALVLGLNAAFSEAAARGGARPPNARANREIAQKLKDMGMDSETILRCKMLMNADVSRSNPSSLLAVKDDLNLTSEQVQKLQELVTQTREKSRAVLTEEQIKKVDAMPLQPFTSLAMHQKMASLMRAKGVSPMNCPMMEAVAATRPAAAGRERR